MPTPEDPIIQNSNIKPSNKGRRATRNLLIFIGFFIAATLVFIAALNIFEAEGESTTSNHVQSVLSRDELKPYTSHDNHFTILMPGIPEINESTENFDQYSIKTTTYQKTIENGSKDYIVIVHDLSTTNIDKATVLNKALDNLLQKYPGAQISTSTDQNGNLEATFNVSKKDRLYESNVKSILRTNKIYSVILIGSDDGKFTEFANSLQFN